MPPIYSEIKYDTENQVFYLEQDVDGDLKRGMIGVSFDWELYNEGHWVWGYPKFNIEVSIPCKYDHVIVHEKGYAKVIDNQKGGLYKYSFPISRGDWDENNYRRGGESYIKEIVPCEYEHIYKTDDFGVCYKPLKYNQFIGQIGYEKCLITDYMQYDEETKTTHAIVLSDNYIDIETVCRNAYLCTSKSGKKELILLSSPVSLYLPGSHWPNEKTCIKNKLPANDGYKIICKNVIAVTNNGVTDVYTNVNDEYKIFEKDVLSIEAMKTANYFSLTRKNGHVCICDYDMHQLFDTSKVIETSDNLSVEFLERLNLFKVTNNGVITLNSFSKAKVPSAFSNREFSYFNLEKAYYSTLVDYTEIKNGKESSTISRIDFPTSTDFKEVKLLSGDYRIEKVLYDGRRVIISTVDKETGIKKYGVIESEEGNVAIDCEYKNIEFDNDEFTVTTFDNNEIILDIDGFVKEEDINENNNVTLAKRLY